VAAVGVKTLMVVRMLVARPVDMLKNNLVAESPVVR